MLEIKPDGKAEELSCYPLDYYGTCPNVGDTIVAGYFTEPTFYSIQRRYFVKESPEFSGWALIVRKIDPTGPPEELWREWLAATKFWDEVAEQEEEQEREARQVSVEAHLARTARKKTPPEPSRPTMREKRRSKGHD